MKKIFTYFSILIILPFGILNKAQAMEGKLHATNIQFHILQRDQEKENSSEDSRQPYGMIDARLAKQNTKPLPFSLTRHAEELMCALDRLQSSIKEKEENMAKEELSEDE